MRSSSTEAGTGSTCSGTGDRRPCFSQPTHLAHRRRVIPKLSSVLRDRLQGASGNPRDADVLLLATLLSSCPLVPFPLLRALRRFTLGPGRRQVEADLCSAWFVEALAADSFAVEREF